MSNVVHVAVGVIVAFDEQNNQEYFLTKRLAGSHQGGKWEFPGGKVEKDETVAQALFRELKEEVAIEVLTCQPLTTISHDYGDKKVCLEVFIIDNYLGEPSAQEGQQQGWFSLSSLQTLDFPAANQIIIEELVTGSS
jgi:8-oxo-dGTP diphosphatase